MNALKFVGILSAIIAIVFIIAFGAARAINAVTGFKPELVGRPCIYLPTKEEVFVMSAGGQSGAPFYFVYRADKSTMVVLPADLILKQKP